MNGSIVFLFFNFLSFLIIFFVFKKIKVMETQIEICKKNKKSFNDNEEVKKLILKIFKIKIFSLKNKSQFFCLLFGLLTTNQIIA
jgi:hypothetical protein